MQWRRDEQVFHRGFTGVSQALHPWVDDDLRSGVPNGQTGSNVLVLSQFSGRVECFHVGQ